MQNLFLAIIADFMKCIEMFGNGVLICMEIIHREVLVILKVLIVTRAGFYVAVTGSTMAGSSVLLSATGTSLMSAAATSAFVLPEVIKQ